MTRRSSQSLDLSPSERHIFIPAPTLADDELESTPKRTTAFGEFYKRNQGLIIIAASQLFFSLMNLCVKVLTVLDKPVPTFEVRTFLAFDGIGVTDVEVCSW
jgi:hypothetical protein